MRVWTFGAAILFSGLTLAADEPVAFAPEHLEFFEREIRPLLAERCHKCHGPDEQEGGLRLDSRAGILQGGDTGPAVVPGEVGAGELLAAISYDPAGYQMPPDGRLPEEDIARLRKWVELGAPWPTEQSSVGPTSATWEDEFSRRREHWSFQPLVRHPLPPVSSPEWCRSPIDRFIRARLDAAHLEPVGESERRTWLRRVYFDTLGLPPTPAEVEAFVSDSQPGAHERVVDALLSSPHFGERWGRHWLDLMRYAESRGHEFDYDVANAWAYRDYVIRAVNADVPYDEFVTEHVAGDLLQGERLRVDPRTGRNESILATGFWFLGEWVHSPVDIRKEEAERFDNMIDVYSKSFLGLTVACARCHDHKFDPIAQRDFYALQGYLQSTSYRQVPYESLVNNERVARALNDLAREATTILEPKLAELAAPVADRLDDYLLAAREALTHERSTGDGSSLVIADFESGTYDGWEITGDAFGSIPQTQATIAGYQGDVGAQGRYFVNSHQLREAGRGDDHVGTLTSPEFVIHGTRITLLVGGGSAAGKTCVNLLVDGQLLRTATGRNANSMSLVTWDVAELRGRTARIEVVDQERGGWGNIGVDEIVQHDVPPSPATEAAESPRIDDEIVRLAAARELDPEILRRWVASLRSRAEQEHDPLAAWARSAAEGEAALPATIETYARRNLALWGVDETAVGANPEAGTIDYRGSDLIVDGSGFLPRIDGLQFSNDPAQPVAGRLRADVAAYDPAWPTLDLRGSRGDPGAMEGWRKAGRTLRTPTFEITGDKVYALVRGGVNTYVAVDSHVTIHGPLHGSLVKGHARDDQWHWVEHDVSRYQGHRAHVEICGSDDLPFAVARVTTTPPGRSGARLADAAELTSWETISRRLAERLGAELVIAEPELFGLDREPARSALVAASLPLVERRQALYAAIQPVSYTAPALLEGTPEDEYIFIRGNWRKAGETAPRGFLSVFPTNADPVALQSPAASREASVDRSGRLQLAGAMVDPEQTPILARVIVNRIWLHYFGVGLVPTPDDFGYLGMPPSHPELLDWLATELVAHDWSLQHIHRLILSSAVYRLASDGPGAAAESAESLAHRLQVDPNNRLLSRMNVKRLEGEIIRDSLLALSGRLDDELYGPSIPIHLTDFLEGRGRPGVSGPLDGNGRRSIYIAVRRNFPEPFFTAFDLPNPHSTIGRRSVSNVPAQSLALMNNPLVREQAERWSNRVARLREAGAIDDRMTQFYREAFSREPNAAELELGRSFISSQAESQQLSPDDPRVWAEYAHALVMAKEFIFVR